MIEAFPVVDPGVEPYGSRVLVQIRTPKKKSKRSEDEEQDAIEMEDIEVVQKKPTKKKS